MNWIDFLTDHQVPYVTRGPNTKRGEVSVKCPWCGPDDPSEHLGINLTLERWGCHRSPGHRGKAPLRLVQALLGCSTAQARLILSQYNATDPETLDDVLKALDAEDMVVEKNIEPLKMPTNFQPIKKVGSTKRFYDYLINRGFEAPIGLSFIYRLRACTTGTWKDRIIVPIYVKRRLLAWTGRAIQSTETAPRYLTTTGDAIKKTIFQEDTVLSGGNILFITEGPFDALKMDWECMLLGCTTTCVFGTSVTMDQIAILKEAEKEYKKIVWLLDPEAIETAFSISEWFPNSIIGTLPDGVEDPGDLTPEQARTLIKGYL